MKLKKPKNFSEIQKDFVNIKSFGHKSDEQIQQIKTKINNVIENKNNLFISSKFIIKVQELSDNKITPEEIEKAYSYGLNKLFLYEQKEQKNNYYYKLDDKIIEDYNKNFIKMFLKMLKKKKNENEEQDKNSKKNEKQETKNNILEIASKAYIHKYNIISNIYNSNIGIKGFEGKKYSEYFSKADILKVATHNLDCKGRLDEILNSFNKIANTNLKKYGVENNGLDFFGEGNIFYLCKNNKKDKLNDKIESIFSIYNLFRQKQIEISFKEENGEVSKEKMSIYDFLGESESKKIALYSGENKATQIINNYNSSFDSHRMFNGKSKTFYDILGKGLIKKIATESDKFDEKVDKIIKKLQAISNDNFNISNFVEKPNKTELNIYKNKYYDDLFNIKHLAEIIYEGGNTKEKIKNIITTQKTPSEKTGKFVYR